MHSIFKLRNYEAFLTDQEIGCLSIRLLRFFRLCNNNIFEIKPSSKNRRYLCFRRLPFIIKLKQCRLLLLVVHCLQFIFWIFYTQLSFKWPRIKLIQNKTHSNWYSHNSGPCKTNTEFLCRTKIWSIQMSHQTQHYNNQRTSCHEECQNISDDGKTLTIKDIFLGHIRKEGNLF